MSDISFRNVKDAIGDVLPYDGINDVLVLCNNNVYKYSNISGKKIIHKKIIKHLAYMEYIIRIFRISFMKMGIWFGMTEIKK